MLTKVGIKWIVLGIIFFTVGASISSAEMTTSTTPNGHQGILRNIFYVGGGGPGNYTSIQDAINDAVDDDIILVYPGIYYEDQILINKALTIQGSGWETTIIDGSDAEINTTGLIRITATDDVLFQGFTIRNAGGPLGYGSGDNKLNMGIVACSSVSNVTYTISQNRIIGTQNPNDDYDWGFYAVSGGKESIIFSNNTITETGCNNIVIEKTTGSTDICYNHLDAGCWGIDPIYYMTYGGVNITSVQMVRNNTIDVGTGINPGGATNNKVTGIGFSSAYLGCTGTEDSGKYTNIVITGNTLLNVKAWRRGIALDNFAWYDGTAGEILNAQITFNRINAVSSDGTSFGIRLSGRVTNTCIQHNEITNCDMSFWGRTGYYGESTAYPMGTIIHYNGFQSNSEGFIWLGPTILNAENNWWGDPSGPHHPDNPGGTGDVVNGSVDFIPWLLYYGPDTTPPEVNIISPIEGFININLFDLFTLKFKSFTTIVIGRVLISVNASDNQSGIEKVEFYVEGDLKSTVTTPPYTWRWSERGWFFPYTLKVIAYDYAGNVNTDSMKVWKIV
jgi:hypothetical protein